jgi:ribosomal protein L31E
MIMAVIERTYTIPLRRSYQKAPMYRRAKKAILTLKTFLKKHMKSDDLAIGPMLNMKIWEKGMQNPPHHVKVVAVKDEKGKVRVELFGFEYKEKKKAEPKKKSAPGLAGKLQDKVSEIKEGTPEPEVKQETATKKDLKKASPKPEGPKFPRQKDEKASKAAVQPKSV